MNTSLDTIFFVIGKMEESTSSQIDMGLPIYILAVASSSAAVVFLVICITVFIIGFVCGHYHGRKFTKETHQSKSDCPRQVPLYEEVLPSAETHQEQAFKLKGNVAYLPCKSTVTENQ